MALPVLVLDEAELTGVIEGIFARQPVQGLPDALKGRHGPFDFVQPVGVALSARHLQVALGLALTLPVAEFLVQEVQQLVHQSSTILTRTTLAPSCFMRSQAGKDREASSSH